MGGQVYNTASETPTENHPPIVDDAIAHYTLPVCEEGRIADRFAYPRRETQMPTPREGRGIHAGDLDNDGLVDIAVNHQYDEVTRVYYGPGFWTPESNNEVVPFVDIPTGRAAKWIDIIDIDGDGYQDIITSETDRGNILVAWGSDQREQWTVDRFDQAQVPTHLSAVDWDQDGFGDVIVHLERSNITLIRRGSPNRELLPATSLGALTGEVSAFPTLPGATPSLVTMLDAQTLQTYVRGEDGQVNEEDKIVVPTPDKWAYVDAGVSDERRVIFLVNRYGQTTIFTNTEPGVWEGCRAFEHVRSHGNRSFYDMNGDGIVDFLLTVSCSYCTSNYTVLLRGDASP